MLHPSYNEMIKKMNETAGEGDKQLTSRFSLVIAASKRARQINAGSEPLVKVQDKEKNLSTAVDELFAGKVHVLEDVEEPEIEAEESEELIEEA